MTINGGSEFMTYGGNDYDDDEYTGGDPWKLPSMDDIKKALTMPNIIIAIVLVVLIIFIYNHMTSSKGSSSASSSYGSSSNNNLYIPSRINSLENSEYTYGSGTQAINTDPVSKYYTFAPA
jgi:hypothetical protein